MNPHMGTGLSTKQQYDIFVVPNEKSKSGGNLEIHAYKEKDWEKVGFFSRCVARILGRVTDQKIGNQNYVVVNKFYPSDKSNKEGFYAGSSMIKHVLESVRASIPKDWTLSEKEIASLGRIKKYSGTRAGDYAGKEFKQACELMKEGKPQDFKPLERHGGSFIHISEHSNAIDFLRDCVQEKSVFRQVINDCKASSKANDITLSDGSKMGKEDVIKELEALLEKVKANLPPQK